MKRARRNEAVVKERRHAAQLKRIALSFPGVEEGTSYGKPSFLLAKKFFTRLRSEDNSLVLFVGSIDERDMLLESDPGAVSHHRPLQELSDRAGADRRRLDAQTCARACWNGAGARSRRRSLQKANSDSESEEKAP